MKRFFKILFIIALVILTVLMVVPMLFQSQIENAVKEEINKAVIAKVDFKDVKLSLISSFPDFKFELNKLSVGGRRRV